jgi:hypothetical protein
VNGGYTWFTAAFNTQIGNDEEYQAQFTLPAVGSYKYAARFSPDSLRWTYCDLDGAGSNGGLDFSAAQLGVMTVSGGGPTVPDAPTAVIATAGNGRAKVSFTAPASNGSAITLYTATSNPGGIAASDAASPVTVIGLANGTTYTFTVTATNAIGTGPASTASNGVTPFPPPPLVISQVFGAGGTVGAAYTDDFVELHNTSANPISLGGRAVQYASSTGSTWQVIALPAVLVPAGGYYLIQMGTTGSPNGVPLPAPDATSTIAMAMTAGKVALTSDTVALTGTGCPIGASVSDFVGYGTTTNCFEGSGPTFSLSNLTGAIRKELGCVDTGDNAADFLGGTPGPRNSASAPSGCAEIVMNETDDSAEADYCVLHFPATISGASGSMSPLIYARLFEAGGTEYPTPSSWIAQIGYGPVAQNPVNGGYTWFPATYNTQYGNDDEYQAQFTLPADGSYKYAARFSPDNVRWTYCDLDGAGSNPGLDFSAAQLGVMTVGAGGSTVPDPPTGLIGTPGDAQATITYAAPASDGGSAITGYTATCTGGSGATGNSIGAGLSITLSPLTNGTTYTCTVVAKNVNGSSAPSASVMVTPLQPSYALTVSKSGSGSGTITSNPAGINCGLTCVGSFANGSSVTLTAAAAAGSAFMSWSGCDSVTTNQCTVTMSGDRAPTATFQIPPAITSANATTFTVNSAGTFTVTKTGSPTPTLSLTGALPTGVTFTAATGVLAGTPALGTVGSYPVTIGAANGALPNASQSFTLTVAKALQTVAFTNPGPQTLSTTPLALTATATSNLAVTFQSFTPVVCTVSGASVTMLTAGTCTLTANQAGDANYYDAPSMALSFTITAPTRLGNISTRMQVGTGNDVMIAGFIIEGSATKRVAVVATGPSLTQYGITNAMANPTLTLVRQSDQTVIATNDDWQSHVNSTALMTAGFAPSNTLESAILIDLGPGAYTAIVSGLNNGTGVGVVGVYEVDHPEFPLINISTRGQVLTGNDVMIGGFIINGATSQTVAIVATGPSLTQYGITNALANPTLTLVRQSDQTVIATNDDWQTAGNAAALQAAGFAPSNPLEAAISSRCRRAPTPRSCRAWEEAPEWASSGCTTPRHS